MRLSAVQFPFECIPDRKFPTPPNSQSSCIPFVVIVVGWGFLFVCLGFFSPIHFFVFSGSFKHGKFLLSVEVLKET